MPSVRRARALRGYIRTYGGSESQYRVILTLDNCDNLHNLHISTTTSMRTSRKAARNGGPIWADDAGVHET